MDLSQQQSGDPFQKNGIFDILPAISILYLLNSLRPRGDIAFTVLMNPPP